jgi:hypothetical protein
MAKKKNKTLKVLNEIIDQHKVRVELDDSCELPAWAVTMIEKEIDRLEKEEKNNGN